MKQTKQRDNSRESRNSGNRTNARPQKENHKSALKRRAQTANATKKRVDRRKRALPYALKVIDHNLLDRDVPAAKAIVLDQICEHGSPTQACLAAGVGRRTFYNWLNESDEIFKKEYIEARRVWRASAISDVESAFAEKAQIRDTLAGIFLLKHNTKRYREVNRVQLSGPDGGPIVTLDAKAELIARLEKMIERQEQKPKVITAGGSEVRELAGSGGSRGLKVVRADEELEGSRGQRRVRRARGV